MNKTTRYSIINISIERLNNLFEKEKDVFYDTIFSSADTHEVLQKLDELKADDDTYSIEIYTADEDGEFVEGSDYDTPSNFRKRKTQ